jgi:hypothetical protein
MSQFEGRFFRYYQPRVSDFCARLRGFSLDGFEHLPQPFIPLFGTAYERSALRMVIVGQDTKTWGDLKNFVKEETREPGSALKKALELFRTREFTAWGDHRYTFFGFVMMLIARLHVHQRLAGNEARRLPRGPEQLWLGQRQCDRVLDELCPETRSAT